MEGFLTQSVPSGSIPCSQSCSRPVKENPPDDPKFPVPGSLSNTPGAPSSERSLSFGEKKKREIEEPAFPSLASLLPSSALFLHSSHSEPRHRCEITSLCVQPTLSSFRVKAEVLPKAYKSLLSLPSAQPSELTSCSPLRHSFYSCYATSNLFLQNPFPRRQHGHRL